MFFNIIAAKFINITRVTRQVSLFKHKASPSLKSKRMSTITNSAVNQSQSVQYGAYSNVIVDDSVTIMDDSEASRALKNRREDEEDFITPKKGKFTLKPASLAVNGTNVLSPSKRYIFDSSSLIKQNKFNFLTDHTYHQDPNSGMESSCEITAAKTKIPPIFLHEANHHQEIIKDIKTIVKNDFTTGLKGNTLKINLSDITDFRNLTKFYEDSQLKFHTFQSPLDKKLEVVLRNVPLSLSEDEIKKELSDLGYPVIKVVRLMNKDKYLLPLCSVDLENDESGNDIFKLNALFHAIVTVEPKRKSKEIPQCVKCQRFGHTKNFCHLDPRCVRCTGQHMFSQCPLSKNVAPVCVNCGENHTANFRGCKHYQDLKLKIQNTNLSKNKKSTPAEESAAVQTLPVTASNNAVCLQSTPNSSTNTSTMRQPGTLPQGTYAEATSSKHIKSAKSVPKRANEPASQEEASGKDSSVLSNFETIIMDLVKSVIPMLKQFITKVIMSVFNNGSI